MAKTPLQLALQEPFAHAAFVLMTLNGLCLEQIRALELHHIDCNQGWIKTPDGSTFPLVSQSIDALKALPNPEKQPFAAAISEDVWQQFEALEDEARDHLAGAVWYTSEEGKLLLEVSGMRDPTSILPLRFTFPFSIVDRLDPAADPEIAQRSRDVLQAAADWLYEEQFATPPSMIRRVMALARHGSTFFLVATTGVSGLNLIHNIVMGRLLTPADYGQLTFIITLQLLIGLIPTALQTITARFSARYIAREDMGLLLMLRRLVQRSAASIGIAVAVILLLASPVLASAFQLDSVGLVLPTALIVLLFVLMDVDRGFLQGLNAYWWLSGAYLSEGIVRLGLSIVLGLALLNVGRALDGAVWALAQSVLVSWFISWLALRHFRPGADAQESADERGEWVKLGGLVLLALVGQALITNSDFLLVKNFFSPEDAGLYAAISVLGRIVYFGALPLTVILVPMIARRQALNQPTQPIFMLLMGGGTVVCGLLIVGSLLFAPLVLRLLYGEPYVPASGLLAPYAIAASLYTLTNLAITYQIALGKGGETWMPVLAGAAQIVGIILLHDSLMQVIVVQVVLMGLLLAAVLLRVLRTRAPVAIPLNS